MLVEQRTYELQPGTLHQFLHAYETEGLALQSAALGNLLGYFTTEVGELNCVVHLWGFDSYEDRQRLFRLIKVVNRGPASMRLYALLTAARVYLKS